MQPPRHRHVTAAYLNVVEQQLPRQRVRRRVARRVRVRAELSLRRPEGGARRVVERRVARGGARERGRTTTRARGWVRTPRLARLFFPDCFAAFGRFGTSSDQQHTRDTRPAVSGRRRGPLSGGVTRNGIDLPPPSRRRQTRAQTDTRHRMITAMHNRHVSPPCAARSAAAPRGDDARAGGRRRVARRVGRSPLGVAQHVVDQPLLGAEGVVEGRLPA